MGILKDLYQSSERDGISFSVTGSRVREAILARCDLPRLAWRVVFPVVSYNLFEAWRILCIPEGIGLRIGLFWMCV